METSLACSFVNAARGILGRLAMRGKVIPILFMNGEYSECSTMKKLFNLFNFQIKSLSSNNLCSPKLYIYYNILSILEKRSWQEQKREFYNNPNNAATK